MVATFFRCLPERRPSKQQVCMAANADAAAPHVGAPCRTQIRAETPGVHSLIICTHNPCVVHAITPLLVAPNESVQQELGAVLSMMLAVVQQQLQMGGQVPAADLEEAASEATWAQHYQLLLWDIQVILHTTESGPGGSFLPGPVAAGVLAAVLEFLGHHGCWCSISWLLAQAIKAKLLHHAKAAAAVRLHQSQPSTAGALCAGFVLGLAASPSPVRRPSAGSSSSSPVGAISRSRRVLSALSAAICGQQHPTTTSSISSYCTAASGSPAALYSSSSSGSPAPHSSHPLQVLAGDCRQQASFGSSGDGISSSNVGRPAAMNILLAVTAACLLLLLVVRGQQSTEQQEGCAVVFEPAVLPGVLGPPFLQMGTVMLYILLIALLVFALSLASRVCLVL